MKNCLIILFALCMGVGAYAKDNKKKHIVANPIDVEYAFTRQEKAGGREAADPMIVLFKDKYYLFATWNLGYWVSDDLCDWTFITSDVLPFQYFAPAVMVYKDELYWMGSLNNCLYKTSNPENGHSWTVASDAICAFRDNPEKTVVDPYLFVDDDQRVYLYWGSSMEEPLRAVELDTEHGFRPKADPTVVIEHNEHIYGWECRGSRNELAQPSCSEGSAMLKYNGRYYLQYAAPGTQFDTYGDGLYTSNNPLGPFVHEPSSPFSVKPGGWMTGAGHGNTFQDKYGNWWHVATTVISQRYKFERRIGLWPVVFTPEGRPYTLTDYSDMPYIIPDRKIDWFKESPWTGWMDLSIGKKVSVSSATANHPAHHASDFTIKTWWSAATGEVGEWLSMDLGQKCCVNAIQANFADEGFGMFEEGAPKTPYRFSLEVSEDGRSWQEVVYRRDAGTHRTHELYVLEKPVKARYVRITNQGRLTGKFSLYDLRVFGHAFGSKPAKVKKVQVERKPDRRRIEVSWTPAEGATGYVVRWGLHPDELYSTFQTLQNRVEQGLFSIDQDYYFRVDAFNENGITKQSK